MVFLATKGDTHYVAFKSETGEDLKFRLSQEALGALVAMVTDPIVGTPERTFPHTTAPLWTWAEEKA